MEYYDELINALDAIKKTLTEEIQLEAIWEAEDAIELRIPLKPIKSKEGKTWRCPLCKKKLANIDASTRKNHRFCKWCGQRIQWEDKG